MSDSYRAYRQILFLPLNRITERNHKVATVQCASHVKYVLYYYLLRYYLRSPHFSWLISCGKSIRLAALIPLCFC